MKKILLMLIFILVLLTGCDPVSYYFPKTSYLDKIESIELIKYNNDDFKMVDATKVTLKFDPSKVEKLETLDNDKIESFLDDYEEIIFHGENDSVNEPTGYCLLWHFKNGNFIVFSCTEIGRRAYSMVAEFDQNCNFVVNHGYFASGPHYDDIVSKYFSSYILE